MLEILFKYRRVVLIAITVIVTLVVAVAVMSSDDENKEVKNPVITTTTTLPEKNAQACEFLTPQALLAGGVIADVDPIKSKDLKRCTYEDIGGEVNYITLYVDVAKQCDVLIEAAKGTSLLPEVSKGAVYTEELDPTIFVKQESRCFFIQGSKTLVDKDALVEIAKYITQLFVAVDSSTTTTTPTTVVLPEVSVTTLPGQNTAPPVTVPAS